MIDEPATAPSAPPPAARPRPGEPGEKVRHPATVVVFSFVTFCIYHLYWIYQVFRELKERTGQAPGRSGRSFRSRSPATWGSSSFPS